MIKNFKFLLALLVLFAASLANGLRIEKRSVVDGIKIELEALDLQDLVESFRITPSHESEDTTISSSIQPLKKKEWREKQKNRKSKQAGNDKALEEFMDDPLEALKLLTSGKRQSKKQLALDAKESNQEKRLKTSPIANQFTSYGKGFDIIKKMGWEEGTGLGIRGTGIVEPIASSNRLPSNKRGLGFKTGDNHRSARKRYEKDPSANRFALLSEDLEDDLETSPLTLRFVKSGQVGGNAEIDQIQEALSGMQVSRKEKREIGPTFNQYSSTGLSSPKTEEPPIGSLSRRQLFSMQPFIRVSNTLQKSVAEALQLRLSGTTLPKVGEQPGVSVYSIIEDRLLPAFTGLGFLGTVEEMNMLVRHWISTTPKDTVLTELKTFLNTGMVLLASKLHSEPDDNLLARSAEVWSSCFCKVVPSLECAFLPLRQDPNFMEGKSKIDIRKIVLVSFRSIAIMPMKSRFIGVFEKEFILELNNVTDIMRKLTQMFSTLASLNVPEMSDHQLAMRQLLHHLRKSM